MYVKPFYIFEMTEDVAFAVRVELSALQVAVLHLRHEVYTISIAG